MPTAIQQARNIGPTSAAELITAGIHTREQLIEIGWEEALIRLVRLHPHRLNLNMACALIGAVEDVDWRAVPQSEKARARELIRELNA